MLPKEDNSLERQKYQLHKQGYEAIVSAIWNIPKTEVTIPPFPEHIQLDISETNKILVSLVEKINEPVCVKLILK